MTIDTESNLFFFECKGNTFLWTMQEKNIKFISNKCEYNLQKQIHICDVYR